jgi:hypothetical protein
MPSYVPPRRATAFVCYVGLTSQADLKLCQVNPTLAAGDVKVSLDGGALANLATLPAVTPAGSKVVKVDLSAAEMTGDNIVVVFSDAAGSEWCDLVLSMQPSARQIDDIPTATENADALLKRDMSAVTGEAARSPLNALRFSRNKWVVSAGTLSVKKEDDATEAWSATVTTAAGNPTSAIDPA